MNEFGVDTAFANYLTQAAVDDIEYGIFRLTDLGASGSGSSAYYNKTFTPDAACLPNMQIVQNNNKPAGMYFFSHAWNYESAAFEARLCCDQLDAWGFRPRLGVFLDFERLGQTGRTGGYENLIYLGITPTPAVMQSIVTGWCDTIRARGYKAGFYMNGDPIRATTDAWIQQARFNASLGSPYFWLAQWASQNDWDCDIWQYRADQAFHGINVDYNRVLNERVLSGGGGAIPIWLMLKIAQQRSDRSGKCTILL